MQGALVNHKMKRIIQIVLVSLVVITVGFAIVKESTSNKTTATSTPGVKAGEKEISDTNTSLPNRVVAYYFHGNARCTSCYKIEKWTDEAIKTTYTDKLNEGILEWKIINVDKPENAHYLQDYKLYSKSVVLTEILDGKQTQWKILEGVWEHLDDQKVFTAYIANEINGYLQGLKK
jgi:hypothetical protein